MSFLVISSKKVFLFNELSVITILGCGLPFYTYSLCRIRVPWPFQWGAPLFDAGEAFAMMMASFVALVEVCFTHLHLV